MPHFATDRTPSPMHTDNSRCQGIMRVICGSARRMGLEFLKTTCPLDKDGRKFLSIVGADYADAPVPT